MSCLIGIPGGIDGAGPPETDRGKEVGWGATISLGTNC